MIARAPRRARMMAGFIFVVLHPLKAGALAADWAIGHMTAACMDERP